MHSSVRVQQLQLQLQLRLRFWTSDNNAYSKTERTQRESAFARVRRGRARSTFTLSSVTGKTDFVVVVDDLGDEEMKTIIMPTCAFVEVDKCETRRRLIRKGERVSFKTELVSVPKFGDRNVLGKKCCQDCYWNLCSIEKARVERRRRKVIVAKPYKCEQCEEEELFETEEEMLKHVRLRHRGKERAKPFTCDKCGVTCTDNSNLEQHRMQVHTDIRPHKCDVCDKAFKRKAHLTVHMRIHTGEKPFKCEICDYEGSTKGHFDEHMKTHTLEKKFTCIVCDSQFQTADDMKKHMRMHNREKLFKCTVCEYASEQSSNLIVHMRTHTGQKPYKCDFCEYACTTTSYLVTHMRRKHSGEKPCKCDLCDDYSCITSGELVRHKRNNHKDVFFENTSSSSSSSSQTTKTTKKRRDLMTAFLFVIGGGSIFSQQQRSEANAATELNDNESKYEYETLTKERMLERQRINALRPQTESTKSSGDDVVEDLTIPMIWDGSTFVADYKIGDASVRGVIDTGSPFLTIQGGEGSKEWGFLTQMDVRPSPFDETYEVYGLQIDSSTTWCLGDVNIVESDRKQWMMNEVILGVTNNSIANKNGSSNAAHASFIGLSKFRQDWIRPTFLEQTDVKSFKMDFVNETLTLSRKNLIDATNDKNVLRMIDLRPLGSPVYHYACILDELYVNGEKHEFKNKDQKTYVIFDSGTTGLLISEDLFENSAFRNGAYETAMTFTDIKGNKNSVAIGTSVRACRQKCLFLALPLAVEWWGITESHSNVIFAGLALLMNQGEMTVDCDEGLLRLGSASS